VVSLVGGEDGGELMKVIDNDDVRDGDDEFDCLGKGEKRAYKGTSLTTKRVRVMFCLRPAISAWCGI
jgi:hypothetical protein